MNRNRLSFAFEEQGINILVFMVDMPVDKQVTFKSATGQDIPQVYVCIVTNKKEDIASFAFQFRPTGNEYADQVLGDFITRVGNNVKASIENKSVSDVWSDFINKLDLDFPDDDNEQRTSE